MARSLTCANCGAAITPDARVCGRCGRTIPDLPPSDAPARPAYPAQRPAGGAFRPGGGGWRPAPEVHNTGPPEKPDGEPAPASMGFGPTSLPNGDLRVEGQARDVRTRTESRGENASETIWTFRVERYDATGNRIALIPVEMRGLTFEGSLDDGDWVRASGKMKSGTLRVRRLENLTTGAAVRSKGPAAAIVGCAILALIALALFIWAVTTFG
ncbi:hypothetical protein ACF1AB_40060 [Streptomyces sp. NPDC014846]|uniref:hypothetical protein n=1 Tax=Streptomyces sp. NPDC014846 TaxID=3364922 RepID=UPI0036FE58AE